MSHRVDRKIDLFDKSVVALDFVYREALVREDEVRETRSEEHTSELQSLMRISYAVFCLKKKKRTPPSKNKRHRNTVHANRNTHHDQQSYAQYTYVHSQTSDI